MVLKSCAFMHAGLYDVNMTVTEFGDMGQWESMQLMKQTDVFMGMHGAGMTNMLWMKPGSAVVQLFPYGWRLEESGELIRGTYYANMATASNATHFDWVNPFPQNAYFRRMDFPCDEEVRSPCDDTTPYLYSPQPTPTMPRPVDYKPPRNWIYQDTEVDLKSFEPVLRKACEVAGISLRPVHRT